MSGAVIEREQEAVSSKKVLVSKGYEVSIDLSALKKASMIALAEHKQIGVYQAPDNSITSFYQDATGHFYFYRWCEQVSGKSSLWLIVKVSNDSAIEYFNAKRTLSDLIVSSNDIKLLEVLNNAGVIDYVNLWDVPLKKIPKCYMPEHDSFFNLLKAKQTMSLQELFKLTRI